MAFRLPPLSSLRLFEAAARHKSFKRAAEELNITPSAVSHGVSTLEDWLGMELFHRGVRGLSLTPAGEAYAASATAALTIVAEATERVPGRRPTGTLAISCAPTFGSRWLLPRLGRFTAAHPQIRVSIDSSHRRVEFPLDGKDLAIRLALREEAEPGWVHVVQEEVVPVCSPALLAAHGREILSRAPLIHVTSISEDWDAWFAATGAPRTDGGGSLQVDRLHMAFEAAAQGLGVTLGRRPLVDDDLARGRLVVVGGESIASKLGYWLVGADGSFDRPEIKAFRRWLVSELEAPGAVTSDTGPKSPPPARSARPRRPTARTGR